MATLLFGCQGYDLIDYFLIGKTINGDYYAGLLQQPKDKIPVERPHLKKVLFHHVNAPAHISAIAIPKIHDLRFELLPHPAYSLAPSDF